MKIAISYPPLSSEKGIPLLSQNRQFQWFKDPTYIYPVVPAYAATMLKENGFDVFWDDGIAEELNYSKWLERLVKQAPEVVVLETKTPVVKRHWKIIQDIKKLLADTTVVLVGDHVSALPEESMENSKADFILTGGDYDFLLVALCKFLADSGSRRGCKRKGVKYLDPGIWYREGGPISSTGPFVLDHDLSSLPFIDRKLTRWSLYSHKNGNFKHPPGTYVMAGRDCWWGRCTFCSWTTLYPGRNYRTVAPERHLDEIGRLIDSLQLKEIFDDSGCFPKGSWLETFCKGMIDRGYHKHVILGCNTRIGAQTADQFKMMKKANFRFLLIGLESVNQNTLDRLRKGIRVRDIETTCLWAKKAGLEPHLTTMVGYPWETKEDTLATIHFAKEMFRRGMIDSLQATIVTPYPGTALFDEAKKKGWLLSEDWDDYDMRKIVWKTAMPESEAFQLTRSLYWTALSPAFMMHKIAQIRSVDDLKYYWMAGRKLFGHLADFGSKKEATGYGPK
jgi:radical SAM superfamily enzyme YgiQ (UPF0313 family)